MSRPSFQCQPAPSFLQVIDPLPPAGAGAGIGRAPRLTVFVLACAWHGPLSPPFLCPACPVATSPFNCRTALSRRLPVVQTSTVAPLPQFFAALVFSPLSHSCWHIHHHLPKDHPLDYTTHYSLSGNLSLSLSNVPGAFKWDSPIGGVDIHAEATCCSWPL